MFPLVPLPHARTRQPGSPSTVKRRLVTVSAAVAAVALAAVALVATATPSTQAARPRIIVGAAGDATGLSRSIGTRLAQSGYGQLDGRVPKAKLVNMRSTTSWRTVANARRGSAVHNDIVRWATTLKHRSGPILFAFHHEPEASGSAGFGSASDYVAAYRRVVDVFRQQGVSNVEYTWQMTSWSFSVSSRDRRSAAKWYPGRSYVDNVGTDPFNWYDCPRHSEPWTELRAVMDDSLAFARAHGDKLVVAEFGSQPGSRRASWLLNARRYFIANRSTIRAVFYFQLNRDACSWRLTSASDLAAFRRLATDTASFTG